MYHIFKKCFVEELKIMLNIDRYSTYITKKYRVAIYIYFEKKNKMCRICRKKALD